MLARERFRSPPTRQPRSCLVAGGQKIAMFIGISNTSPFTLISQPNIKSRSRSEGKRLGTARFGGSSTCPL